MSNATVMGVDFSPHGHIIPSPCGNLLIRKHGPLVDEAWQARAALLLRSGAKRSHYSLNFLFRYGINAS